MTMWFKPSERGSRLIDDDVFRMTFTEKPRGIRFNAYMSKRLAAHKVKFVQVGFEDQRIVVKPAYSKEDSFALMGSKNGYQISAAALYHWAAERELIGMKVKGEWNEFNGAYEFDLSAVMQEDDESESIAGTLDHQDDARHAFHVNR